MQPVVAPFHQLGYLFSFKPTAPVGEHIRKALSRDIWNVIVARWVRIFPPYRRPSRNPPSPRNVHVVAAASPRLASSPRIVSVEYPLHLLRRYCIGANVNKDVRHNFRAYLSLSNSSPGVARRETPPG